MLKKSLLSLLFTIAVIGVTVAQDFTIRGFIYEKANGEPVGFEKIRILNASDSSTYAGAVTDVNGFFSIPKVAIGKYILKIENFSYNTITKNIEVTAAK